MYDVVHSCRGKIICKNFGSISKKYVIESFFVIFSLQQRTSAVADGEE